MEEIDKMADNTIVFDELLEDTWHAFQRIDERMITEIDVAIKQLMAHPKEDMDVKSYMQMFYMMGCKYSQNDNKNAALYCAMRLLWMKKCLQDRRMKRPRLLTMQEFEIPASMDSYIAAQTAFMENKIIVIERKLRILSVILFFVFFVISYLVFQTIWISMMQSLLLCLLNYLIQKRRFPVMFMKRQSNAVAHYAEQELLTFDHPYQI